MKKLLFISLLIVPLVSCNTPKESTQDDNSTRWPDFLREWAEDYEIVNPQRQAIIDLIDTLYRLVDDSTENTGQTLSTSIDLMNTERLLQKITSSLILIRWLMIELIIT